MTTDINQIHNMKLKSNIVDAYSLYNGSFSCFTSKLVDLTFKISLNGIKIKTIGIIGTN